MSGYLVAQVVIKDPKKWAEYTQKALLTIKTVGGAPVFKDEAAQILAGNSDFNVVVLIKFPNREVINQWFQSEEYQVLVPLRDSAADVLFFACNT